MERKFHDAVSLAYLTDALDRLKWAQVGRSIAKCDADKVRSEFFLERLNWELARQDLKDQNTDSGESWNITGQTATEEIANQVKKSILETTSVLREDFAKRDFRIDGLFREVNQHPSNPHSAIEDLVGTAHDHMDEMRRTHTAPSTGLVGRSVGILDPFPWLSRASVGFERALGEERVMRFLALRNPNSASCCCCCCCCCCEGAWSIEEAT